jgi:hypothetical protein
MLDSLAVRLGRRRARQKEKKREKERSYRGKERENAAEVACLL